MNKEQKAKEITEKLQEISQLEELENLLQKNEFIFESEKISYRVRKPNQKEKIEANEKRMIRYFEMLKDEKYMFEAQIRELYNKKGVSLDTLDHQLLELKKQEDSYLERLAQTTNNTEIASLKEDIGEVREEKGTLLLKKAELLQYCIESQLEDYIGSYILYLVLEKKVNEKWEKVFLNYDDFLKTNNEDLLIKATYFLSMILYNKFN